jgi:cell division protein FtsX
MKQPFVRYGVGLSLLNLIALAVVVPVGATQPDSVVVKVEFKTRPQATPAQEKAVMRYLRSSPYVEKWVFVSKEAAFKQLKKRYPELVAGLSYNPLPDVITVTPTDPKYVRGLVASLRARPGVEAVHFGRVTGRAS